MSKPTYPAWHLFTGRKYVPAHQTNVAETIRKAREQQARERRQALREYGAGAATGVALSIVALIPSIGEISKWL